MLSNIVIIIVVFDVTIFYVIHTNIDHSVFKLYTLLDIPYVKNGLWQNYPVLVVVERGERHNRNRYTNVDC